jgi:hypothetical protein
MSKADKREKEIIMVNEDKEVIGHCTCGFVKKYPSNYELSEVDTNPNNHKNYSYLERINGQMGMVATMWGE